MGLFGSNKPNGYIFKLDYALSPGNWVRGDFRVPYKDAKDGRSPSNDYWIQLLSNQHHVHPSKISVCRVVNHVSEY